jgi:hypothetical protein
MVLSSINSTIYVSHLKCNSRDPQGLEVKVCSYEEVKTVIDLQLDIKKPIPSIWVDMAFLCKVGNKFRKFGSTEKMDWCGMIKSIKSIKNSYVKNMINMMKEGMPQAFKCPIFGQLNVSVPLRNRVFSVLPPGNYSLELMFYDKKSPNGVNVSIGFQQTLG